MTKLHTTMQQTLQSDDLCKLREDWLSSKPEQSEEQSAGAPVADLKSKDQKKIARQRPHKTEQAQKRCQPHTSSAAQGGGGNFKNRRPIGRVGCCDSRMDERIH
jgi:hypothetical protein